MRGCVVVKGTTKMGQLYADTVLMALRENGPLSLNDLAQITGINKRSPKVVLSRLKKGGLGAE